MALSPLRSKAPNHVRSLSLPSDSHPAISQFDENLSRVRASEASCSSLSSMNGRINDLRNLYDSIDDLLLSPHNQRIISQEQILDDYVRLLDVCNAVRDLISLAKQDLRELLSALRRKDVYDIQAYLISGRKSKKMIQKSLKNLRSFKSKCNTDSLEKDMLKHAESVTLSLFECLLSYVMGAKVQGKKSGWSLVSKVMHSMKVSSQREETYMNEFKMVDSILQLN